MKASLFSSLTCFRYRRRLALRIDRGEVPRPGEARHLDRCPRCRADYRVQSRLIAGLRSADPVVEPAPRGVRERVLATLERDPPPERRPVPLSRGRAVAGAAAAAAVAMLAIFAIRNAGPDTDPAAPGPAGWLEETDRVLRTVESVEGEVYRRELQLLLDDGRNTARFLVSSFPREEEPD